MPNANYGMVPGFATSWRFPLTQNYQRCTTRPFRNTLGMCAESVERDTEISVSKGVEIFHQTKLA